MKNANLILTTIIALFIFGCDKTDTFKDETSIDKQNQFLLNEKEMIQIAGEVQFGCNTNLKSTPVS